MKSPACSVSKSKSKLASSSEVSFNPFRCDVCDGEAAEADDDEDLYCRSSDCNQCASEYYELRNGAAAGGGGLNYRKLGKKRRSCSLSNLADDDLPDILRDSGVNAGGLYYSSSNRYARPEDRRFNIENSYYETLRETEYLHEYKNELRDLQAIGYCEWVNFHLDRIRPEDLVKLNKFYSSQLAGKTDEDGKPARLLYKSAGIKMSRKDSQTKMYLFVANLSIDLSDGIRLLHLIEILYNCKLQKEFGKMKLHKMRNMATCLEYLVDNRKLKCFGINLADLVNGNLDIMLGLLFHIRRDYESAKFALDRQYKLSRVKSFFQNYETNKQMAQLERDKREKQRARNRLFFKSPLTLSRIKQAPKRREGDEEALDEQSTSLAPQSSSSRSSLCSHCPHRKKFNLPAIKVEDLSDDETQQPQQEALEVSQALDQVNNVYESIENLLENSIQRLNHLKEANEVILQKIEQSNKNLDNSNSNELDDSRYSQLDETLNDIDDEPSFNSDIMAIDSNTTDNDDSFLARDLHSSMSSQGRPESSQDHVQIEQSCAVDESNQAVEEIEIKASKTSTDLKLAAVPRQDGSFEEAIAEEPRGSVEDVQSSSFSSNQGSMSPSPSVTSTTTTSTSEPQAAPQPQATAMVIDYAAEKPRIIILEQVRYAENMQGELNYAKTKTLRKDKPGITTINEKVEEIPTDPLNETTETRASTETTTTTTTTTSDDQAVRPSTKKRKKKNRKNRKLYQVQSSDTGDQDYCEDDDVDERTSGDHEPSSEISSEIIEEESSSQVDASSQLDDASSSCPRESSQDPAPVSCGDSVDESSFEVPGTPNVSEVTDESLSLRRPRVIPLGWSEKPENEPIPETFDEAPVEPVQEPVTGLEPTETAESPISIVITEPVEEVETSQPQAEEPEPAESPKSSQPQRRNRKKRRISNYYGNIIDLSKEPEALQTSESEVVKQEEEAVAERSSSPLAAPTILITEPSSSSDNCQALAESSRESESPLDSTDCQAVDELDGVEEVTEIRVGTRKIVIVETSPPETPRESAPVPETTIEAPVEAELSNQPPESLAPSMNEEIVAEEPEVQPKATLNDFIVSKPSRKPTKKRGGAAARARKQESLAIVAKNDDSLRSKDRSPDLPPDSLSSSNSLLSLSTNHDPGSYQRSTEAIDKDPNNNDTCQHQAALDMESKGTMTSESMTGLAGEEVRLVESLTLESPEAEEKKLPNGHHESYMNGSVTIAQSVYLQTNNLGSIFSSAESSIASYSSLTSASSSSMGEDQLFAIASKSQSTSPEPTSSSASSLSSGSAHQYEQVKPAPEVSKPAANGRLYPNGRPRNRYARANESQEAKKPAAQINEPKESMNQHLNQNGNQQTLQNGRGEKAIQPPVSRNESTPPKKGKKPAAFEVPIIRVQHEDEETPVTAPKPAAVTKPSEPATKPKQQPIVTTTKTSVKSNGSSSTVPCKKSNKTASEKSSSSSCFKKTLLVFLIATFVLTTALVTFLTLTINEGNFNLGDLLTMTKRYLNN